MTAPASPTDPRPAVNHCAVTASQTCSQRPCVPLFSSWKRYAVCHLSPESRTLPTFSRLSMHFEWINAGVRAGGADPQIHPAAAAAAAGDCVAMTNCPAVAS